MKRRDALRAAVAALVAGAGAAYASSAARRIGWLYPGQPGPTAAAFVAFSAQMQALGYVEGRDVVYVLRATEGREDRLPELARDLVQLRPAVIVTGSTAAVATLQKLTREIPVVFGTAGDPVGQGFVASLARPGGNITGLTLQPVRPKLLELIRETLPAAKRVAMLFSGTSSDPAVRERARSDASKLGLSLLPMEVERASDLERAFASIAAHKPDALYAPNVALLVLNARRIIELALDAQLPVFGAHRQFAVMGGLISYTNDEIENYRRAALLVDKILKGRKPGDLPVDQPERMRLTINAQTAEALGITIPGTVRVRADEVIE